MFNVLNIYSSITYKNNCPLLKVSRQMFSSMIMCTLQRLSHRNQKVCYRPLSASSEVCTEVRLKLACSAAEAGHEISKCRYYTIEAVNNKRK